MPYIGNPIYQSAFVTDTFSGNGSTTAYTMSVAPAGTTNVLVVVSGVVQDPSTYGVVGNTLNFTTAPPTGTGNISCRYLGVPVTGVTTTAYRTVTEFTATAGQTTFTPPSYTVGFINVYLNGVLLGSADYTATNGTTVVLATGAAAGNLVTVESFQISSVLNAIPDTPGAVTSSNLSTGAVTVTKINATGTPSSGNYLRGDMAWATIPAGVGGSNTQVQYNNSGTIAGSSALTFNGTNLQTTGSILNSSGRNMVNQTGGILQVQQTVLNSVVNLTADNSYTAVTGLSTTITPSSTSSKILVTVTVMWGCTGTTFGGVLYRNGSIVSGAIGNAGSGQQRISFPMSNETYDTNQALYTSFTYLDSPASTSAQTYALYVISDNNATIGINRSNNDSPSATGKRGVSTIMAQEIAG